MQEKQQCMRRRKEVLRSLALIGVETAGARTGVDNSLQPNQARSVDTASADADRSFTSPNKSNRSFNLRTETR
jgi:lipid II:glycine glycyltransferase (peptidoglycan interpeptide bridge formation enzyme)